MGRSGGGDDLVGADVASPSMSQDPRCCKALGEDVGWPSPIAFGEGCFPAQGMTHDGVEVFVLRLPIEG